MRFFPVYLEIIDESKEEVQVNPENNRFGFRFKKNFLVREITTKNYSLFLKFKSILQQKYIQRTFYQDYDVLKMIGKGSFAQVFLVKRKDSNEKYAVKIFKKTEIFTNMKGKGNLINEIWIMRQLNHPNLLKLYEIYESSEYVYLIVESLEGGELMQRISKRANYDEYTISLLMKKILEALKYLHSKKIIHRDLKPENLLLKSQDNNHELVIADFGLAADYSEPDNILIKRGGTPGFIDPEILNLLNEKNPNILYNEKSDVYSAGIILFMLIVGRNPFSGKNVNEILRNNKSGKIDFEIEELKKASNEIVDLLKKMLKPTITERISIDQAIGHIFFNQRIENYKNIEDTLFELIYKAFSQEYKKAINNQGTQAQLLSAVESSIMLNIQDNGLKGQLATYLSNPDLEGAAVSGNLSLILKNVSNDYLKKINEANNKKMEKLNVYLQTEENKIEEDSMDKELEENTIKSKDSPKRVSGEIYLRKAILHNIKKEIENRDEKEIENFFSIDMNKEKK